MVRKNSLDCPCPFLPFKCKSIISNNNGECTFLWQTPLSFFPPKDSSGTPYCLAWTKLSLALVVSSSISSHVCGGVVRRWLSRNTEALKPHREIFPHCVFEVYSVKCDCWRESLLMSCHLFPSQFEAVNFCECKWITRMHQVSSTKIFRSALLYSTITRWK